MRVVGIIAEYNPLHNGHIYHLERARAQSNADYCIVVLSGNFVQRGEAACTDKFSRTAWALRGGADLVLELPSLYAVSAAERFAAGECEYEVPNTARATWTCTTSDGSAVVRYGYWEDPSEPRNHYPKTFRKGKPGLQQSYDFYVGDELAGQAWESSKVESSTGRYVLSAVWLDWQYTVTVESVRRSELSDLFGEVSFRELTQVKGHPEDEVPIDVGGRLEPR